MAAVVALLSLLVSMDVFLALRQPGLTLAGDADCGIMEHTHGDECGAQLCICNLEGTTHVHDAACYETRRVDAREERQLMCSETETLHTHNGNCYETVTALKTELVLLCENQDADHSHGDACYKTVEADGPKETVLKCDLVYEPHQHTDACFMTQTIDAHEEQILKCVLSEGIHTHSEACYKQEMTCGYEEHVHSIDCYADKTADTETMLDWQRMFADYPYTGDLRRDLVGIAKTQVGYCESTRNFEIGQDGISRGYTRYGAWYGAPYSDWSAMFVSFCLHYAGADPAQAPGNTGAVSMAQLWNNLGKYVPSGDYVPRTGDLVFFSNNTVGIVAEVYNATAYVICGDVNDMVCGDALSVADGSIVGWGITGTADLPEEAPDAAEQPEKELSGETEMETEETPSETEKPEEEKPPEDRNPAAGIGRGSIDLLDISNGPAVFIFAGSAAAEEFEVQMPMLRQTYSFRAAPAATQIAPYLDAYGGHYFFTLFDYNNQELPKDENGNYMAYSNTGYKLTISFNSPKGFTPGIYQYQTPYGLKVDGGEGEFILEDGTNVGSWTVTDDGLITLVFNEHMNSRSEIVISSTLGIHFPEQQQPIDFDGKITVTVEKPPDEVENTKISKWGVQGSEGTGGKPDAEKLYWTVHIVGEKDSNIPGNTVSDKLLSGEYLGDHHYTQENMDAGLSVGVSRPNPNGGDPLWYSWVVKPGDENLAWTESGWSYVIPESIWYAGQEVPLGNDGWEYYIEYSTTPKPTHLSGSLGYMNQASLDNQFVDGWAEFTHGESYGSIVKNGSFVTDAGGGTFLWEFQATIPGRQQGQKADYYWYIMDNMSVRNSSGGHAGYVTNDANLASVTVTYHGQTIQVPRIQDATANDLFAWNNSWSAADGNGVNYGRAIDLLCRCNCTEESCPFSDTVCEEYWYRKDDGQYAQNGFCQCWTETQDLTFTFTYETKDLSMLENYGGFGNSLRNEVILYKMAVNPGENPSSVLISNWDVTVPIPGLFDKALTKDFDGHTAHYRITVNEAKLMLTNGTPLQIHDVMTDTLAFISGSLVITAEDAAGNISTLQQGVDYTVTYDGTGNTTDNQGESVHILDIVILRPQPVKYILDYDTTLIFDTNITESLKYKNSAMITLWGTDMTETTVEKVYADINISAKSYKVDMFKTSALTGEPLPGATFGLFNGHGGLISSEVTDHEGKLHFQTNVVEGIILQDHELCYLQEMDAPPGYQLDDTKFWFCFCDKEDLSCTKCDEILAGAENAFRIPFEEVGIVRASNEFINYDLPATGGSGVYPLIVLSVMFIVAPLIYGFILRRKQERRGVG